MLKKKNTNGHKLPTNFHELFLILILIYNYGFVKDYHRLDKTLSKV